MLVKTSFGVNELFKQTCQSGLQSDRLQRTVSCFLQASVQSGIGNTGRSAAVRERREPQWQALSQAKAGNAAPYLLSSCEWIDDGSCKTLTCETSCGGVGIYQSSGAVELPSDRFQDREFWGSGFIPLNQSETLP